MREHILSDNKTKLNKFHDNVQAVKVDAKVNGNAVKSKYSLWGSQIVRGFTTEKKSKQITSNANKKPPLAGTDSNNQKNQYVPYHSRVKRSLISDFPCSANAAQVHDHAFDCDKIASPASRDLFIELDHLRELLRESKERELALQCELSLHKKNQRTLELEHELELKRTEVEGLNSKIRSVEVEKASLSEQLVSLSNALEQHEQKINLDGDGITIRDASQETKNPSYRCLEIEVVELRRVNKDLQLQKRNLALRLSSVESELSALAKVSESDIVAKVQAEASVLRDKNENLSKQVEGLQMSRLNEVEELAYLRWVNSCLRHELCSSDSAPHPPLASGDDCNSGYETVENNINNLTLGRSPSESISVDTCSGMQTNFVKGLAAKFGNKENSDYQAVLDKGWIQDQEVASPQRRHSISGTQGFLEDLTINKRRQSDSFFCSKDASHEVLLPQDSYVIQVNDQLLSDKKELAVHTPRFFARKSEPSKLTALDVEKRALRIPKPPPRPSTSLCEVTKVCKPIPVPPPLPPPPPPLPKFSTKNSGVMQRAPQVAELYHSLMKRDSKTNSSGSGIGDAPSVANVRSSMIGEIENRSSHLLAIKADVETQGEFVKSLISEVNNAAYHDIEDVVAFVRWLDDELCFLVDERAVLKHFDWPEKKADTLREAAFGYLDLKKMEYEVSSYKDDPRLPCDIALKKMVALSEKMERSVYNLLRTRDAMLNHCKAFRIPIEWMLDTGIISKIKIGAVKLAKKYMERVATELKTRSFNKDPTLEYMLLQGVRFAFRIHQFAGGFDAETMRVFEELRNLSYARTQT